MSDGGCGLVTNSFLRCPPRACAVCAGGSGGVRRGGALRAGHPQSQNRVCKVCALFGAPKVPLRNSDKLQTSFVFNVINFLENPESLYGLVVTALPHLTTPVRSW